MTRLDDFALDFCFVLFSYNTCFCYLFKIKSTVQNATILIGFVWYKALTHNTEPVRSSFNLGFRVLLK